MFKTTFIPVLGGMLGSWLGSMLIGLMTKDILTQMLLSIPFGCVGVYVGYKIYQQIG